MEFEEVPGLLHPPLHHEPDHGLPVLRVLLRLLACLAQDRPRPVLAPGEVEAGPVEQVGEDHGPGAGVQVEDLHQVPDQLQLVQEVGLGQMMTGLGGGDCLCQ